MLLWGLVAFAARPNDAPPAESLPVEFVSATEFSQLTAGVKNAPKAIENAKPLADKVGEPEAGQGARAQGRRQAGDQDRRPCGAAAEVKPKPKAAPKAGRKAEETKPKPDQIADALKKDEAKKPPKPKKPPEFKPDQIAEQLKKEEPKKPPSKFDADQVAALLDQREPQRQLASAGDAQRHGLARGARPVSAAQLSQSELDALQGATDLAAGIAAGG